MKITHALQKLSIPLIFLVIMVSCQSKQAGENDFVVKGKLSNSKGGFLKLEELTPKEVVTLDSVKLKEDGSFFFRYKPKEAGFYFLTLSPSNHISFVLSKGETVEYFGDYSALAKNYQISGSQGSELLKQINDKLEESYTKVDSLKKTLEINKYRPNFLEVKRQLDSNYILIRIQHKKFLQNFIESHLNSLVCITALYQDFGTSHVFSERKDFSLFERVSMSLISAYPENTHAIEFKKSVEKIRKTMEEEKQIEKTLCIGLMAPDFKLPDTSRTQFSLSALKGKVVLIDFWTSVHPACRNQNKLLASLYNKYKAKGFEILGVSLDKSEAEWKSVIYKDKMAWKQVCDFMYFDSPAVKMYNVSAIPYLILLDREGKIVAKGLENFDLEKKITETLKK